MSEHNSPPVFNFTETYVHLEPDNVAEAVRGGALFWQKIDPRFERGRIVCAFRFEKDWDVWERHPGGEEIVFLIEGSMDLVLEESGGERVVELRGRGAVIVPRGVWHTARVHAPSEVLHITPGKGTEHRPRG